MTYNLWILVIAALGVAAIIMEINAYEILQILEAKGLFK
jgi:hypothetical protein